MALQPGTTLGPYSVTAKIGEGGMGEVYRARDTTLDRDVAIKVLPDAFASDPERVPPGGNRGNSCDRIFGAGLALCCQPPHRWR